MADFRFDEKGHEYYYDNHRIPSVTDIVSDVCGEPQYANEWHMHRGSMVHKAIALYLQNRLDEDSVDKRIEGKFAAAKKAIRELGLLSPYLVERPMYHPLYQFGGKPDLITGNGSLIDWKSGHQSLTTSPQLGGYVLLAEAQKYKIKTCLEIVLDEDGKYKLYEYKPRRCRGLFLAMKTIYDWKQNGA